MITRSFGVGKLLQPQQEVSLGQRNQPGEVITEEEYFVTVTFLGRVSLVVESLGEWTVAKSVRQSSAYS